MKGTPLRNKERKDFLSALSGQILLCRDSVAIYLKNIMALFVNGINIYKIILRHILFSPYQF
ncbi:hypothetical protein BH09BAC6_BH09BAC6_32080 [soil metagenome]